MTSSTQNQQIKVWDPLIRIFHWTLVISFIVAYATGDELMQVHIYAGYLITGLLVFRLIWGFVGTKYARFSNFLYGPAKVIDYLKSLRSGTPRHYLGHNPAGAVMVFLLLISLTMTVGTGLIMDNGGDMGQRAASSLIQNKESGSFSFLLGNPAYADDDGDEEEHEYGEYGGEGNETLEELHEFFANFTLFLVILHIGGVIVSSRLHRENLVQAMITGKKTVTPEE